MKNIELEITGMHCTGCSTRLEKILNQLEGVEGATVSFEKQTAFIQYREEKITLEKLKEAIIDAGFEA